MRLAADSPLRNRVPAFLAIALAGLLAAPLSAQPPRAADDTLSSPSLSAAVRSADAGATGTVAVEAEAAAPAAPRFTARQYLQRLEEKNRDVKTMIGRFTQVRSSEFLLYEETYQGRFYYQKPNQFRIEYRDEADKQDEGTVLILENELWEYIPSIEQATRINLRGQQGAQRELNQFLLAFGVKAEKALEFFEVAVEEENAEKKTFRLRFDAKNPDETLQFLRARITFDATGLRPLLIELEEAGGDKTRIELGEVEFNSALKSALFKPEWPKGTEILEQ